MECKKRHVYRCNEIFNSYETNMGYIRTNSSKENYACTTPKKESYTCITPKKHECTTLEKQVIHAKLRKKNYTCTKPKERVKLYVHDYPEKINNPVFHPYTFNTLEVLLRVFRSLWLLFTSFLSLISAKSAGHWIWIVEINWRPKATIAYSANLSWPARWAALMQVNLCTNATNHSAAFFPPSTDKSVQRPHFGTCSKKCVSIPCFGPLVRIILYLICAYHMSKLQHIGLHIWYWMDGVGKCY